MRPSPSASPAQTPWPQAARPRRPSPTRPRSASRPGCGRARCGGGSLARRRQFCGGDEVDVEPAIAVVVEERHAVAAGFEDVVLGRAAAVGGHRQRRGFLEGDGRRDGAGPRRAAGGLGRRTHAGGVAAVDRILDLRLAVAAFERETERDLALEADAGALEQREDRRGVESRVGGGRGAHGLRGAAQALAQIGVETVGRRRRPAAPGWRRARAGDPRRHAARRAARPRRCPAAPHGSAAWSRRAAGRRAAGVRRPRRRPVRAPMSGASRRP